MPTYLCHGFRWHRATIRIYVIVQDLDEASPEWVISPRSSRSLLESLYDLFDFLPRCAAAAASSCSPGRGRSRSASASADWAPDAAAGGLGAQDWSAVKLLEEYAPARLDGEPSAPHAYVADYAMRVDASVSVTQVMRQYEEQVRAGGGGGGGGDGGPGQSGWLESLRDQLQSGEEIGWYFVVNEDEVRGWDDEAAGKQISTPTETGVERGIEHVDLGLDEGRLA